MVVPSWISNLILHTACVCDPIWFPLSVSSFAALSFSSLSRHWQSLDAASNQATSQFVQSQSGVQQGSFDRTTPSASQPESFAAIQPGEAPLKRRRRRSLSSGLSSDDVELPSNTATEARGSSMAGLGAAGETACAGWWRPRAEEPSVDVESSTTTTTLGNLVHSYMRPFGSAAITSAAARMGRELRELLPRVKPTTLRFLKVLGRVIGAQVDAMRSLEVRERNQLVD